MIFFRLLAFLSMSYLFKFYSLESRNICLCSRNGILFYHQNHSVFILTHHVYYDKHDIYVPYFKLDAVSFLFFYILKNKVLNSRLVFILQFQPGGMPPRGPRNDWNRPPGNMQGFQGKRDSFVT